VLANVPRKGRRGKKAEKKSRIPRRENIRGKLLSCAEKKKKQMSADEKQFEQKRGKGEKFPVNWLNRASKGTCSVPLWYRRGEEIRGGNRAELPCRKGLVEGRNQKFCFANNLFFEHAHKEEIHRGKGKKKTSSEISCNKRGGKHSRIPSALRFGDAQSLSIAEGGEKRTAQTSEQPIGDSTDSRGAKDLILKVTVRNAIRKANGC